MIPRNNLRALAYADVIYEEAKPSLVLRNRIDKLMVCNILDSPSLLCGLVRSVVLPGSRRKCTHDMSTWPYDLAAMVWVAKFLREISFLLNLMRPSWMNGAKKGALQVLRRASNPFFPNSATWPSCFYFLNALTGEISEERSGERMKFLPKQIYFLFSGTNYYIYVGLLCLRKRFWDPF